MIRIFRQRVSIVISSQKEIAGSAHTSYVSLPLKLPIGEWNPVSFN